MANETAHQILIPSDHVQLEGDLIIPEGARGVVIFAHGSGSSRLSSRNRFVAQQLREAKLATLLMDLLTRREEQVDDRTAHLRFNIDLLAERLLAAAQFIRLDPRTMNLPIGLFGASTGGGAALVAAARKPDLVRAVVSRGGRPDLADDALPKVRCPTLLIVGGRDDVVIDLNEEALRQMTAQVHLEIVPGATHLFEEAGALEKVARLARNFLGKNLYADVTTLITDGLDPQDLPQRPNL